MRMHKLFQFCTKSEKKESKFIECCASKAKKTLLVTSLIQHKNDAENGSTKKKIQFHKNSDRKSKKNLFWNVIWLLICNLWEKIETFWKLLTSMMLKSFSSQIKHKKIRNGTWKQQVLTYSDKRQYPNEAMMLARESLEEMMLGAVKSALVCSRNTCDKRECIKSRCNQ